MAMSKWPRLPRGGPEIKVAIAVPLGRLVPLTAAVGLLAGAGVLVGSHLGQPAGRNDQVVVRVIDDGAPDGPAVLSTQIVPLR